MIKKGRRKRMERVTSAKRGNNRKRKGNGIYLATGKRVRKVRKLK